MADKIKEDKIILEREYTVPLRRKWLVTPYYKRTPKAIRSLRAFVARNMRVYENADKMIRIDKSLNEELWQGSIRRPPRKIKIKCKKFESGIVKVELAVIPEFVKWKIEKAKRKQEAKPEAKEEKKPEESKEAKEEEKKEENAEEKKIEEKEKQMAEAATGIKLQKQEHKEMQHEPKQPKMPKHERRMALQK